MIISRIPQKNSDWLIAASLVTIVGVPPKDPPDDEMRTKKTRMMMTRTTKSQQSSENRTNVDAKDSGLWLLEITDYR